MNICNSPILFQINCHFQAVEECVSIIFVCSPYGLKSYTEFRQMKQLATWKDDFVIALNLLENIVFVRNKPRVYFLYSSSLSSYGECIDEQMLKKCCEAFDFSRKKEREGFSRKLIEHY